ncbi:hypothetical protein GCM10010185_60100 [Saccharothrix coeruleofusca]|uniref:Polyketide cyclase/dehydrase/lipid transport protein n=1 Tax=Saccharothrix coeruleofusca TaxID=33919 RepID=A0A918EHD2_9PSEU|nr:hypothetical protein GCM10010185_60100 [Saccharothrix coeruleofusca]
MTRSLSMPADAENLFEIITDLENLSAWLPRGLEVERYGPNLVRLWLPHGAVERHIAIDWENLRVVWGSDATPSYRGRVQVLRIGPHRSAVTADVVGASGIADPRVDSWLDQALHALAEVVAVEHPCTPPRQFQAAAAR